MLVFLKGTYTKPMGPPTLEAQILAYLQKKKHRALFGSVSYQMTLSREQKRPQNPAKRQKLHKAQVMPGGVCVVDPI